MLRTLFAAILLLVPAFVLAEDFEGDFQKAVVASGAEYIPLRDQLVRNADEDFLKKKAESESLQEKVVARSVLAWKEHGKLYSERLEANLYMSKPGNLLFDWFGDQSVIGNPDMIPLAIEMLIKNSAGEEGLFAGSRIVGATARKGAFKDQDLLFGYLGDMPPFEPGVVKVGGKAQAAISNAGGEGDQRRKVDPAEQVAQGIVGLPPNPSTTKRIIETLYKIGKYSDKERVTEEERKADKERISKVASILVLSLVRSAGLMSPPEKKALMVELTSEEKLMGVVGPEATLKVAGLIGGPEASAALLKYLRGGGNASIDRDAFASRTWAFSALRNMRDASGPAALREYALDTKMVAARRETALENIAGLRYSDENYSTVSSILEDSSAPTSVRFAALRALDQLFRANRGRQEITEPLRKAILETSFSPTDENYAGPVKMIKDVVRETP